MIEDYLSSIPIIATYQTKNSSLADGKPTARLQSYYRKRNLLLYRLEILFTNAAERTAPILGNILESCSCCNT